MAEPASHGGPPVDASDTSSARRKTPFGMSLTIAGRYRRGACIAKGGSSTVHRATDLTTGAEVALKSFHVHRAFDPELLPSLERGRAIAARVGADVLVPILDLGADDDGTPFVVMPLLDAETLAQRVERAGPMSVEAACQIAQRLLASLDALHACGVTHGDLSPNNVVVHGASVTLVDHEEIGAIGAARPTRVTEGFGQSGGVREARDDHRALAAIVREVSGIANTSDDDATLDRFVVALREARTSDAADLIAPRRPPSFVANSRVVIAALVVLSFVLASLAWLAFGPR